MIYLDPVIYKLEKCGTMLSEFQRLMTNTDLLFIATAKYGGPVALIKNKDFMNLGQSIIERDLIYFFDWKGKLFTKMKFVYMDRIVCFEFLKNEHLLIVLDNGQY